MQMLGSAYLTDLSSDGISRDEVAAARWLSRAAELGLPYAMAILGEMYSQKLSGLSDDQQAVAWFRRAAEVGVGQAMFDLGQMYSTGLGVPKDDQQALGWYVKAADGGLAKRCFTLAKCMTAARALSKMIRRPSTGIRGRPTLETAARCSTWGSIYLHGRSVAVNYQEAVSWYRKAAVAGEQNGNLYLARIYEYGLGVVQDTAEGLRLCQIAANARVTDAKDEIAKITTAQNVGSVSQPVQTEVQPQGRPPASLASFWVRSERRRTPLVPGRLLASGKVG